MTPSAPAAVPDGVAAGPADPAPRRSALREVPLLIMLALVLALLIKALLVQAFFIPSVSMRHTLEVGDRVLVNKLVYDFRGVHRGEVVVFNGIDDWVPEGQVAPAAHGISRALQTAAGAVGLGSAGEKDFIKRVIGLPGDRVMCCSAGGRVVVRAAGGTPVELVEPYLFEAGADVDPLKYFCAAGRTHVACPPGAPGVLVPKHRLWVMGDHRGKSGDSRAYLDDGHSGTIPIGRVVGRAFVVVWPVDRFTILGVPHSFSSALAGGLLQGAPLGLGLAGALPVVGLRRRRRGSCGP